LGDEDTARRAELFQGAVRDWAIEHSRDFPWRHTIHPFHMLVAEMMLRRTRATQVVPVYERFISRYPCPARLARATESEVEEILRPLGLRWRVPAFRQAAQRIVAEFDSAVPRDRPSLLTLPGVGEYVADAIRCFSFGEAAALVDTNTVRVAGRYFGIAVNADSRRRSQVRQAVRMLIDPLAPRASNLAVLDFAATVCLPSHPACQVCPVTAYCAWYRNSPAVQASPLPWLCHSVR
jgi:A/G-specific adenine glycosylase